MGKHETGYARVPRDLYPTPPWVTAVLVKHIDIVGKHIWESACGDGRMSEALIAAGARVYSTDIADHGYAGLNKLFDFTWLDPETPTTFNGIITNPPFGPGGRLAEAFIKAGFYRMGVGKLGAGESNLNSFLALLLPADFDSAKTRRLMFGDCLWFKGKIVLTRRVKWFEHPTKPTIQPKENSAWFLWGDVEFRAHEPCTQRQPVLGYAP